MANHAAKKSNTLLYVIILIIVIVLLGLGIYFVLDHESINTNGGIFSKSIKEETITEENYQEMMDKIEEEMKDDEELYYLSYSMMYYMIQDGVSSAFTNPDDENAMYVNIYGKTVQELIDEGKQLMKDNGVTIEEYKQGLENLNNINIE